MGLSGFPGLSLSDLSQSGANFELFSDAVTSTTLTGTTDETVLKTYTIPANPIGRNGALKIRIAGLHTNNANTKTYRIRVNGNSILGATATTSATGEWEVYFSNQNSLASQKITSANGVDSTSSNSFVTSTIDTSQPITITITGTLANIADTMATGAVNITAIYKD